MELGLKKVFLNRIETFKSQLEELQQTVLEISGVPVYREENIDLTIDILKSLSNCSREINDLVKNLSLNTSDGEA